jgi:hypothetical protein
VRLGRVGQPARPEGPPGQQVAQDVATRALVGRRRQVHVLEVHLGGVADRDLEVLQQRVRRGQLGRPRLPRQVPDRPPQQALRQHERADEVTDRHLAHPARGVLADEAQILSARRLPAVEGGDEGSVVRQHVPPDVGGRGLARAGVPRYPAHDRFDGLVGERVEPPLDHAGNDH